MTVIPTFQIFHIIYIADSSLSDTQATEFFLRFYFFLIIIIISHITGSCIRNCQVKLHSVTFSSSGILLLLPEIWGEHTTHQHKTLTDSHNEQGGDLLLHCVYVCQADGLILVSSVGSLITTQIKSLFTLSCRYKNAEVHSCVQHHIFLPIPGHWRRDQQW